MTFICVLMINEDCFYFTSYCCNPTRVKRAQKFEGKPCHVPVCVAHFIVHLCLPINLPVFADKLGSSRLLACNLLATKSTKHEEVFLVQRHKPLYIQFHTCECQKPPSTTHQLFVESTRWLQDGLQSCKWGLAINTCH